MKSEKTDRRTQLTDRRTQQTDRHKVSPYIVAIIMAVGLMGLMGCTGEDDESTPAEAAMAGVTGCVTGFEEAVNAQKANRANEANEAYGRLTRAWLPPTDPDTEKRYAFFEDGDQSISVFFTQVPAAVGGYQEEFFYKPGDTWRVSKTDLAAADYYLYGYRPHEETINATVSLLEGEGKTYADGAVLRLENISTVMTSDLSVVIGAKNGISADNDNGLIRGQFKYTAKPTSGDGKGSNYVFLLFNHLYSAMRIRMRVQGDYAALRTIKLKDLSLQAFKGEAATTKKMNATITLNKKDDGSDPISSIVFESNGTETATGSFFSNENGLTLTTDYQTFHAHFMPEGVTKLKLISTYDVYDRHGNLIRPNCTAPNTLEISKLFSGQTNALRGCRYTISMTIQPTYLYVMSEPDLDNPDVILNEE